MTRQARTGQSDPVGNSPHSGFGPDPDMLAMEAPLNL
jgi:hypothetical protein